MKKLKSNFIALILCSLVAFMPAVYADNPTGEVFEVPSLEQSLEENKPAPSVVDENFDEYIEDSIEPDLTSGYTGQTFWKNIRYIGLGFICLLVLLFIFNKIKAAFLPEEIVENPFDKVEEQPSTENFDKALNTFIKRNL